MMFWVGGWGLNQQREGGDGGVGLGGVGWEWWLAMEAVELLWWCGFGGVLVL
jgi:hypothetical protein